VARVRAVFEAASRFRMPIVVHLHTSLDRHRNYGAAEARVFLDELLPAAAGVPVQIAHLAGSGAYDDSTDSALGVLAEAIRRHDPRMKRVWFDVATVVPGNASPAELRRIADRIRQLGIGRVLYGSDAAASPDTYPRAGWAAFRRLPLDEKEFRRIAANVTPYMRWTGPRRPRP
jgi:predicted TIM-barrel fold metal-dependent hydrolase